ncbi:MAG: ABC transporter permease [Candidatus Limnocylindria bacterium]
MSGRRGLVARRLLRAVLVLWGAVTIVFVLIRLSGDPVSLMAPAEATPAQIEDLRRNLRLDGPLIVQYLVFLRGALLLDFGQSIRFNEPAMQVVLDRLGPTVELALLSMTLALVVAIPLGIFGALRANRWSGELAMGLALLGQSTPVFFFGILLILLFSAQMRLLPTGGHGRPEQLIMPTFTLALWLMASIARLTRSSMLDVMGNDYIRTARSKGLRELLVIRRHALKNAALPVVTVTGLLFGSLLGGAVVTETIFSWPGIGRLTITAIGVRDYPVVQAAVFLAALWFVIVNTLIDLFYVYLDPRIRYI